ncbi:MAG: tRNA 4-thiouridine(8) synthase ThiI [Thermodesulfobacteriota bacterium]
MAKKIRALGLLSGGLDSMLAALVLRNQGIEVVGVCFTSPFFGPGRAREAAAQLELPLREIDFTEKFLPLLYRPPHGWGRGHNPCIDCHILMLREAGALMDAEGFDFLFTGEVLGQRPMSQNRGTLTLVARESGFPELVLRPLSAKLLKPTQPELLGWVDRERLLDISGRGRKRQIVLAKEYGLSKYPAPAGGCLLTDPGYATRLKELLKHQETVSPRELELLKWGRHFRLPGGAKAIVGRTHRENEALLALTAPGDLILKLQDYPGPKVLIPGGATLNETQEAAALTAAYGDAPTGVEVIVTVQENHNTHLIHLTTPTKDQFRDWLI